MLICARHHYGLSRHVVDECRYDRRLGYSVTSGKAFRLGSRQGRIDD